MDCYPFDGGEKSLQAVSLSAGWVAPGKQCEIVLKYQMLEMMENIAVVAGKERKMYSMLFQTQQVASEAPWQGWCARRMLAIASSGEEVLATTSGKEEAVLSPVANPGPVACSMAALPKLWVFASVKPPQTILIDEGMVYKINKI